MSNLSTSGCHFEVFFRNDAEMKEMFAQFTPARWQGNPGLQPESCLLLGSSPTLPLLILMTLPSFYWEVYGMDMSGCFVGIKEEAEKMGKTNPEPHPKASSRQSPASRPAWRGECVLRFGIRESPLLPPQRSWRPRQRQACRA